MEKLFLAARQEAVQGVRDLGCRIRAENRNLLRF